MPKTNRPAMVTMPVRFPPTQRDQIELEADAQGVSDSELVRRAVWYYFDRGARVVPDTSKGDA